MAKQVHVKLDASVFDELVRRLEAAGSMSVKVGVLAGDGSKEHTAEDGTPSGKTIAEIAAIHEFGAPKANIPERSFIRRTFTKQRRGFGVISGKLAKAIVDGMPVTVALEALGQWGAAAVKNTIKGPHIPPPLKPATIAARQVRSTRPLVDTGQLINSISHEVVK